MVLNGWAARLRRGCFVDGNGQETVLSHYCRLLRLLSGVHNCSLLNLADGLVEVRSGSERAAALRADPKVREFVSWLEGLERTDQNTVWAMLGHELFPGVASGQSIFGQDGADSLSAASREVFTAVGPSVELLTTIVGEQAESSQHEGDPRWGIPSVDEVLQVVLGVSGDQLAQGSQVTGHTSAEATVKTPAPGLPDEMKDGEKKDERKQPPIDDGQGRGEESGGSKRKKRNERSRKRKRRRSRRTSRDREKELPRGEDMEQVGSEAGPLQKEPLPEQGSPQQTVGEQTRTDESGAKGKPEVKEVARSRSPRVAGLSFQEVDKAAERTEQEQERRRQRDENRVKSKRELKNENRWHSPPRSHTVKVSKEDEGPTEPPIQPPKRPVQEVRSESTWTWRSGESELCETAVMVIPARRHGWNKVEEPIVFLPSGAVTGPVYEVVCQRPVLPSQCANCVVLMSEGSGVNATLVQMGHNALDRLIGRCKEEPQVVDIPSSDRGLSQSVKPAVCARTGLRLTSRGKDWQCPNSGCINSTKMVFAKWSVCPLCKSPKPVDPGSRQGAAMVTLAAPAVPRDAEGSEGRSTKERKLLDQIQSKQMMSESSHGKHEKGESRKGATISSNESEEGDKPMEVGKGQPAPTRPIFGVGWTRSSTEGNEGNANTSQSSFTKRPAPGQYVLEWGMVDQGAWPSEVSFIFLLGCVDGIREGEVGLALHDENGREPGVSSFGAPCFGDLPQDPDCPVQMEGGEEPFRGGFGSISPTVPFTVSQGGECRQKAPTGEEDLVSMSSYEKGKTFLVDEEVVLFFRDLFCGKPAWLVNVDVQIALEPKQVMMLVTEGPWMVGDCRSAKPLLHQVQEMLRIQKKEKLEQNGPLAQLDSGLKDDVAALLAYYDVVDGDLSLGQIGNFRGRLVARLDKFWWKFRNAEVSGVVRIVEPWNECVGSFTGDVTLCRVQKVAVLPSMSVWSLLDSGAVVRNAEMEEPFRVLDLFAGIGGWSDAVSAVWGEHTTAIEIDGEKAKALSHTTGLPLLSKVNERVRGSFIFAGDVFDLQWLKSTWHGLLWSSPCVSWSRAGYAAGLNSKEGMTLLRALGLLAWIRPKAAVGENVAAVVGHQHFVVVQEIALWLLGVRLTYKILDLQDWAAMERKRVFLYLGLKAPAVLAVGVLPFNRRKAAKAVIADEEGLQSATVPPEVVSLLQEVDLLPKTNRCRLRVGYVKDDVIKARIEYGILPVIMASYRKQHLLPRDLLCTKGLFTFLVKEDGDEFPRYLDFFEAARHLGFGMQLHLPADDFMAMHAVGNAMAPVQAVEVVNDVMVTHWPELALTREKLRKQIMSMLYGQADLRRFTRVKSGGFQRLVPLGYPQADGSGVLCFWGDGCVEFTDVEKYLRHECSLLPYGNAWPIEGLEFVKAGLGRLLRVVLRCGLLSGEGFVLKIPPWTTVDSLVQIFGDAKEVVLKQIGVRTDQQLAFLTMQKHWRFEGVSLEVRKSEIMLIFGVDKRIGEWHEGLSFQAAIDLLFPFALSPFVQEIWDVRAANKILGWNLAPSGPFQVFFGLVPFWICPFGRIDCEPLQTVAAVQHRLVHQFFQGQGQIELQVEGKAVEMSVTIALAAKLGSLVARHYPDGCGQEKREFGRYDVMRHRNMRREVEIRPHGFLWCEVCTTVSQVVEYLADRYYAGRKTLHLTCNGALLEGGDLILVADTRGCLRARFFPLRGGGLEQIAESVVLGGKPEESVWSTPLVQVSKESNGEYWHHDEGNEVSVVGLACEGKELRTACMVQSGVVDGSLREESFSLEEEGEDPTILVNAKLTPDAFARGISFPPYGVITCGSHDTVAQVQEFLALHFYGGHDVVRVTSNGVLVDPCELVHRAALWGCLGIRVFPLREVHGGS